MAQAANAAVQCAALSRTSSSAASRRASRSTPRDRRPRRSNATVEADRAAVENAQVQLQYATISAPMSGRTGALMVHAGNLVRANDTTPLVIINQVAPISVSLRDSRVAAARAQSLHLAQGSLQVTATPPNEETAAVGRITFVDNAVDQNTGTISIKGTFPNSDRRLWPGQFVNVVVTLTTDPSAIVVPSVAVQAGQQGPYVFIGEAPIRPSRCGRSPWRGRAAPRRSSRAVLKAGETVVTDGQLRLVPGSRISIKGADAQQVTQ